MSAISKIEVECAAISAGHLAALIEVLVGHAEQTTDGNIIIEALSGCMRMACGIRDDLDAIVNGSLKA